MGQKKNVIDRKFKFVAVNPANGHVYTEENAMVFVAKDAAMLDTLEFYKNKCKALRCDSNQVKSLELLIKRVSKFQSEKACHIPDISSEEEVDRCIKGKL